MRVDSVKVILNRLSYDLSKTHDRVHSCILTNRAYCLRLKSIRGLHRHLSVGAIHLYVIKLMEDGEVVFGEKVMFEFESAY